MDSRLQLLSRLAQPSDSRILQIVLDGVGGVPGDGGMTELAAARTPNLDALALRSETGLLDPVARGITPGSGLAHLALFGYDPMEYEVGRGVLAAGGVGLRMQAGDVAARCNFITLAADGCIADRRAGRIGSDEARAIVQRLQQAIPVLDGFEVLLAHVMEYRFCALFRGKGLDGRVTDTDPQVTGVPPLVAAAADPAAQATADLANRFIARVREVLQADPKANAIVMRGFDSRPHIPDFMQLYGMKSQVIASYPDYKGVAALVGMEVQEVGGEGEALEEKVACCERTLTSYEYTFFHVKKTDSYGEDQNFAGKVKQIEAFDAVLPRLLACGAEVIAITGDHCTPAAMGKHSWHPVPVLVHGPWLRGDSSNRLTEDEALRGGLGRLRSQDLLAELLAQASRLKKYGA